MSDGFVIPLGAKFTCSDVSQLPQLHSKVVSLAAEGSHEYLVGRALRFFVRACLMDAYSDMPGRLDQIVWLSAALDALTNDGRRGATDRMARRTAKLVGCSKRDVLDLYNYRSRLVHGDHVDEVPVEVSWFGFGAVRKALRAAIDITCDPRYRALPHGRDSFLACVDDWD